MILIKLAFILNYSRFIFKFFEIFQIFHHFHLCVATLVCGFVYYKPIASQFWARHLIEHVLIFKRFSGNPKRMFEFWEKSKLQKFSTNLSFSAGRPTSSTPTPYYSNEHIQDNALRVTWFKEKKCHTKWWKKIAKIFNKFVIFRGAAN